MTEIVKFRPEEIDEAIEGLDGLRDIIAPLLRRINGDGMGEQDAQQFIRQLTLAKHALIAMGDFLEEKMTLMRAHELAKAEKDGRLVVLPPVSESASAFQKNLDIFELSIAIKWAHAAALMDENPEVSHLFLLSEIALNEKLERLVNAQPLSDQLAHEEAEAALKKREDQAHD